MDKKATILWSGHLNVSYFLSDVFCPVAITTPYIPMDEIRALRQGHGVTEKIDVPKNPPEMKPDSNIIPVERDHYEGLLTRVGTVRGKTGVNN